MYTLTAHALHTKFLEGALSAEEIAHYFLRRIRTFDKDIGAFLSLFEERVLTKARALDKKRAQGMPLGRLAAVPIGLKDNIHVQGELTTCASKFLANYRAPFAATVTRLLEEEDALLLGKLNLDEFAMGSSTEHSALQETRNPWDLRCVPGGSSGGPAAAVAARLCPITLGSDTGGSIRHPAAFCGVFGFKPSYGRVSRYGLVAFGSSLDQIGPLAASMQDVGMVMEVIGRHDPWDATTFSGEAESYLTGMEKESLQGKVIGVPWGFLEGLSPSSKALFQEALARFTSYGCRVVEVDLDILHYSVAAYYIIATAEASTNLARFDGIRYGVRSAHAKTLAQVYDISRTEGFGAEVKKRILLGTYVLSSGFQEAYYKQATKVRQMIIHAFHRVFETCEVVAMPSAPSGAFVRGAIHDPLEMYLQDVYTIGVNLAKLPALSLPIGLDPEGKPFGMQLIGKRRGDLLVCGMGRGYEREGGATAQLPPLYAKEADG